MSQALVRVFVLVFEEKDEDDNDINGVLAVLGYSGLHI